MTVLSRLSLTTMPCISRLGISDPSARPRRVGEEGLDPRDVASYLAHPRRVLQLPGRPLKAQIELLLLQLQQLIAQLVLGLGAQVGGLHRLASSPGRTTKRVRTGSLAAPRRIASSASVAGTP